MSLTGMLRHRLLIKHPDPAATADATGQLFVDSTGQPIGDATSVDTDWSDAAVVDGLVEERTGHWPQGPGAGPEIVETRIWLTADVSVIELDKILRTDIDPAQAYQVTYVNRFVGYGSMDHTQVAARRIPL